ncbi:uncharacterized protein METZ01_LOCUS92514 [marine metagenome]|uniref:Oxidoreductase NAD-binding domain-containing protein 1 n=1 Tax=marine metagenome TaxID=408172 RepID=A0A381VH51_9ZZZZ
MSESSDRVHRSELQDSTELVSATISDIRQVSPTKIAFTLLHANGENEPKPVTSPKEPIHLPGQWVDLVVDIEGKEYIGGYSIISSPSAPSISLAVKDVGTDRVTRWIHDSMSEGDRVKFTIGGDFFYTSDKGNALLLAGGIGITPLLSIFRYVAEQGEKMAALIHSASTPEEFIYRKELQELADSSSLLYYLATATQVHSMDTLQTDKQRFETGRLDASKLRHIGISKYDSAFICGPPKMIQAGKTLLETQGFPTERIEYEQWW